MSECRLIFLKNNELYYECKECNNESYKTINGLIKKFQIVYQVSNNYFSNFVPLLKKGVYPYEGMNRWEKFNEASLPDKKNIFQNELNEEGITDEDYAHAQKV